MVWHVMRMGENRIPKKMLHTKLEEKRPRGNQEPDGQTKLKRIQKWDEKIGKEDKKAGNGRTETNEDFFIIVDPYIWKQLKNNNDDDDEVFFTVLLLFWRALYYLLLTI